METSVLVYTTLEKSGKCLYVANYLIPKMHVNAVSVELLQKGTLCLHFVFMLSLSLWLRMVNQMLLDLFEGSEIAFRKSVLKLFLEFRDLYKVLSAFMLPIWLRNSAHLNVKDQ